MIVAYVRVYYLEMPCIQGHAWLHILLYKDNSLFELQPGAIFMKANERETSLSIDWNL